MKCPCCGQQTDAPFLISGRSIAFNDGRVLQFPLGIAELLDKLKNGPIPMTHKHATYVSRLRQLFREHDLPFGIATDRNERCYSLLRLKWQR